MDRLTDADVRALGELARAANRIADRPEVSPATAYWIRAGAEVLLRRMSPPTPEPRRLPLRQAPK